MIVDCLSLTHRSLQAPLDLQMTSLCVVSNQQKIVYSVVMIDAYQILTGPS